MSIENLPNNFDSLHGVCGGYPKDVKRNLGFTVCGGLAIYRPTKENIRFWSYLAEYCKGSCDDQHLINSAYLSSDVLFFNVSQTEQEKYVDSEVGYHKVGVLLGNWAKFEKKFRHHPRIDENFKLQIMTVSQNDMLRGGDVSDCKTTWIMNPHVPKVADLKVKMFEKFKNCGNY